MKKIIYFLSICATALLMTQCSNNGIVPNGEPKPNGVESIEKDWDFKSISILQSMKFNTINQKLKSLSKEELNSYERNLVSANEEYIKNPSKKSLEKFIQLLGFADTNDYLFKNYAEKMLKDRVFENYYQGNFSEDNTEAYKSELSKINSNNSASSQIPNSVQDKALCQLLCANSYALCGANAINAYNNATSGSCSLDKISGCQPIYQWVVIGASAPNTLDNGCIVVNSNSVNFGNICGLGSTPVIVNNGVFIFDFDPSRSNQMIVYGQGGQTNDCNDYNAYNSCLAAKANAKNQADIAYALAVLGCINDLSTCNNGCN